MEINEKIAIVSKLLNQAKLDSEKERDKLKEIAEEREKSNKEFADKLADKLFGE